VLDVGTTSLASEQRRLNAALAAADMGIRVALTPAGAVPEWASAPTGEVGDGIYYRTPRAYRFAVYDKESFDDTTGDLMKPDAILTETIFYAENDAAPQFLPIDRSAFVKRDTTITLAEGFPTKITTLKPSEVVGFMSIPLDIITAIVAAPGQLLTVKVEQARGEQGLLREQQAVVQEQNALLQNQIELVRNQQEMKEALQPSAVTVAPGFPEGASTSPSP
jgi:hypothetical protein